jgi:hypothetical protein
MWHFGVDGLAEYTGERFCMTWKVAEKIIVRAYSKNVGGKIMRLRLEKQELPMKSLAEAIEEKLQKCP